MHWDWLAVGGITIVSYLLMRIGDKLDSIIVMLRRIHDTVVKDWP